MSNPDEMMDPSSASRLLDASRRQGGTAETDWVLLIVVAFCLATLFQSVAYRSVAPALVATVFLVLGYLAFHEKSPWGSRSQCFAFVFIFTLCYFWSGVAALFANYLDDPIQRSDTAWFYELATNLDDGLSLDEIRRMTSGAGAIYAWRVLYKVFSAIGFEKGIYIAVASNTFFVAIAGVVGVKTAALIFGEDQRKLKNMAILFAFSGIYWLFGSVLLRDSTVLLLNTLLFYAWVRVLMQPTLRAAALLFVFSLFSLKLYEYIRTEYFFVPYALLLTGEVLFFGSRQFFRMPYREKTLSLLLGVLCAFAAVTHFHLSESNINSLNAVTSGTKAYLDHANRLNVKGSSLVVADVKAAGSSLGVKYVLNQWLPIRLSVGALYLQMFPIPFWRGFVDGGIYHILKSLNAIYMWFVFPMAILGVYRTWQCRAEQSKRTLVFLSITYAGFSLAVAGSSLETRHLGSFSLPLLMLALVPNLSSREDRSLYIHFLGAWLALNVLVHLAWAILKLT
jgi:hypothetical protein